MLLYRYFSSHAFESLQKRRLKVSLVSSFNDPFECMYRVTGVMTKEKAADYFRRRLELPEFLDEVLRQYPHLKSREAARRHMKANKTKGIAGLVANFDKIKGTTMEQREAMVDRHNRVICFSASTANALSETLMWSHYADKHRGVRIGFEIPDDRPSEFKIRPITYSDARVEIDLSVGSESNVLGDALMLSLRTKSTAWAYEHEYRLTTLPRQCIKETNGNGEEFEFFPIEKSWVKRIDFGARFPWKEISSLGDFLSREYPHVERYTSAYHPTDYALIYDRTNG